MINLIGAIACIAISLIWYMPGIRLQGDQKVPQKGDYMKVAFLYGLLISCLLILSIVYMVKTIKKMRNTARNSDRLPDPGQA